VYAALLVHTVFGVKAPDAALAAFGGFYVYAALLVHTVFGVKAPDAALATSS
jgi:hypothetical protein